MVAFQDLTDPEVLRTCLENLWVRFIQATFLIDLRAQGRFVMRHQEVQTSGGIFCTPDSVLEYMKYCIPLVVALSYRWIAAMQPDPAGHHLKILAHALKLLLDNLAGATQLAVFWDYVSLPQPRRDAAEEARFRAGLGSMTAVYAHAKTWVFMQTSMPSDVPKPYNSSGWCTFESTASSILKNSRYRLDISLCTSEVDLRGMVGNGCSARAPPLLPAEFSDVLDTKQFTTRADVQNVKDLYTSTFNSAAASANELFWDNYNWNRQVEGSGWGPKEARKLAAALPRLIKAERLVLRNHTKLGELGMEILAPALARMPASKEVDMRGTGLNVAKVKEILKRAGVDVQRVRVIA